MAAQAYANSIFGTIYKNQAQQEGVFFTLVHYFLDEGGELVIGENSTPNNETRTADLDYIQDIPKKAVLCSGQALLLDKFPVSFKIEICVPDDKVAVSANRCAVILHTKEGLPMSTHPISAIDNITIGDTSSFEIEISATQEKGYKVW